MLGVYNFFDDIYTPDKFEKPLNKTEMIEHIISAYSLEKSQTYMIGDRESDISAANAAGVASVGALWGYGDDKTFVKENADILINNISELNIND